jgi:HK97 family phage major capsid protein
MTTMTLPTSQEEFEEALNDRAKMKAVWEDGEEGWQGFVRGYAKAALETAAGDPTELSLQMREQVQLGMQEFLRDQAAQGYRPAAGFRPGAGPALTGREARRARAVTRSRMRNAAYLADENALFNERALGAAVDEEEYAANFGKFMYAIFKAEKDAGQRGDTEKVTRIQDFKAKLEKTRLSNAMSERIPSEGGFLVPENLRSEILMVALETAVIRPRARIIPMDSLRVPLPSIDDTSHASNVYGGVQAFWTEEGAALASSAPTWGRITLEAKKLTAYTAIPNELLQDSTTSLDMWFNKFFPTAVSWFEDVGFISGTGVGEPQGILQAPGAVRVPVGTDYTIAFADIAKAYSQMWPASLNRAVWLCSPDVLLQLLLLALTSNSTTIAPPLWLQQMNATDTPGGGNGDGVSYRLMGRPLIVTEKMPSGLSGNTTTPGALTLVDLDYYLLGDRQTMQVASSDEYLFGQDMIAYRIIERLDGRFWLQSPITPENGSSQKLSPLVKIDTTATS